MDTAQHTYVFMDESGDAGFKVGKGSTPLFCIAAVIVNGDTAIQDIENRMASARTAMHLRKSHEFHFTSEPQRIRESFCEIIREGPFRIRAIVIDKDRIYNDSLLRRSPTYFYNFTTRMLLEYNFGSITNARVYIDGSMNRGLKTYLQQQLNKEEKIVTSVKFKDSATTPLIQLADMAAGSIVRSYNTEKRGAKECRHLLTPRIEDVWEFGRVRV